MIGEEVRHWFEQAVNITAGGRAAFLESNCRDEAARSEVLSLLEYDAGNTGPAPGLPVPEAMFQEAIGAMLGKADPVLPARRVDPFELGRLLGSGGMGFVYEGHRVDGTVRQRVAVKFAQVSPGASRELRESAHRRFYRERQMLASLRHPYIAGLIDASTTADGIPYAVIEQAPSRCNTWKVSSGIMAVIQS